MYFWGIIKWGSYPTPPISLFCIIPLFYYIPNGAMCQMKIRNFLKTIATKKLSKDVEEELKKKDPELQKARAILNQERKDDK